MISAMTFTLDNVVPWGRSFDEYVAMFALGELDLARPILGCGDGPAAFNAIATQRGHQVISIDPLYRFSPEEIALRIEQTAAIVAEQTRRNAAEFCWTHFRSAEELVEARLGAMRQFLADLPRGRRAGRYLPGELPTLPFPTGQFAIALCSHFLFLYSEQHDVDFHVRCILELCRVAREVRIFPLFELGSRPSRHLDEVLKTLHDRGLRWQRVRVGYEFQRGANEMLQVLAALP
jgi:hypothetical protein